MNGSVYGSFFGPILDEASASATLRALQECLGEPLEHTATVSGYVRIDDPASFLTARHCLATGQEAGGALLRSEKARLMVHVFDDAVMLSLKLDASAPAGAIAKALGPPARAWWGLASPVEWLDDDIPDDETDEPWTGWPPRRPTGCGRYNYWAHGVWSPGQQLPGNPRGVRVVAVEDIGPGQFVTLAREGDLSATPRAPVRPAG